MYTNQMERLYYFQRNLESGISCVNTYYWLLVNEYYFLPDYSKKLDFK